MANGRADSFLSGLAPQELVGGTKSVLGVGCGRPDHGCRSTTHRDFGGKTLRAHLRTKPAQNEKQDGLHLLQWRP
jgi:hypothetical protein